MKTKIINNVRGNIKKTIQDFEIDINDNFFVEINECGELCVKGAEEIKYFSAENILLSSEVFCLDVYGKGLAMKEYSRQKSLIVGTIEDIKLIKSGGVCFGK